MVLKDKDHLSTEWLMVEAGEVTYTAAVDLERLPTRAKDTTP